MSDQRQSKTTETQLLEYLKSMDEEAETYCRAHNTDDGWVWILVTEYDEKSGRWYGGEICHITDERLIEELKNL